MFVLSSTTKHIKCSYLPSILDNRQSVLFCTLWFVVWVEVERGKLLIVLYRVIRRYVLLIYLFILFFIVLAP